MNNWAPLVSLPHIYTVSQKKHPEHFRL